MIKFLIIIPYYNTLVAEMSNKRAQRRRYRKNNASVPVQKYCEYEMIDGNWTVRPYGYCFKYRGYLTRNMAIRHKCEKKKCSQFHTFEHHEEWKTRPENLPEYKYPSL